MKQKIKETKEALMNEVEVMKINQKNMERGESSRHFAIAITELEAVTFRLQKAESTA